MFTPQVRMAKSAKAVEEFLADLATKLKPLVDKELKELLRYKTEEVGSTSVDDVLCALCAHQCQQCRLSDDGRINAWDFSYYCNMVKEKNYAVDQEEYRPYFPLPAVTKGKSDVLECV